MELFGLAPSASCPEGQSVHGCRGCGGVWVDGSTLAQLIATAVPQPQASPKTPRPAVHQRRMASTKVVYRRCAVCSEHMLRRNFARVSGVVVDECRKHGTFFDAGELEDVLAFVRSGGLKLADEREQKEQAWESRNSAPSRPTLGEPGEVGLMTEVGHNTTLIGAFASWAARWVGGH